MIVKNGGIMLASAITGNYAQNVKTVTGETVSTHDVSIRYARSNCFVTTAGGNTGVVMNLGSGSTPVTEDDYFLAEPLTSSDYECIYPVSSEPVTGYDGGRLVYTYTFRALRDITIREICISSLDTTKVMYARSVIPQRAVQAGETFTFSYVIKFN